MPILQEIHYPIARPLFQNLGSYHLCGWAVLSGAAPGTVWVDDPHQPHVGVIESSEGCYLAGDPGYTGSYATLRKAIPPFAYLICDPPEWEQVLGQVWSNVAARRHEREHYVFQSARAPEWRDCVPPGMRLLPVDQYFWEQAPGSLENFRLVDDWVDGWRSRQDFLERGAAAVVVQGDNIASISVMDCALGERCEIGVHTAMPFRRQGLGRLVVSAVLEMCLERGYRQVGWQCLRNNSGSKAIAHGLGFTKERDYLAFSGFLPAESAGDMTAAEWADWGAHYQRFLTEPTWAFMAVQAWSMAGQPERAVENLRLLKQAGWKAHPQWIAGNWRLDGLRTNAEAAALLKEIQ